MNSKILVALSLFAVLFSGCTHETKENFEKVCMNETSIKNPLCMQDYSSFQCGTMTINIGANENISKINLTNASVEIISQSGEINLAQNVSFIIVKDRVVPVNCSEIDCEKNITVCSEYLYKKVS